MSAIRQAFKSGTAAAVNAAGFCSLGVATYAPVYGVLIGGTFVGTVIVEVSNDPEVTSPTWCPFGAAVTAPGTVKIDVPVKAIRLRCSAYTSGTILGYIGATDGQSY